MPDMDALIVVPLACHTLSLRPLVVHAGWRTSVEIAGDVVLAAVAGSRTPEPLREARRLARTARSHRAD